MRVSRIICIAGLGASIAAITGCNHIRNTCNDYYAKRITVEEAAKKLQVKLERTSIGDGIAWGTAGEDIDRYCIYNK